MIARPQAQTDKTNHSPRLMQIDLIKMQDGAKNAKQQQKQIMSHKQGVRGGAHLGGFGQVRNSIQWK